MKHQNQQLLWSIPTPEDQKVTTW